MRNGRLVFGSSCHLNCTRSAPDTGSSSTVRRAGSPGPDSAGSGSCRAGAASPRVRAPGGQAASPARTGPSAGGCRPPARLPWRSTGCTRRLVTVSHRAMISSLSSRPSRFRQPSVSRWLSPDISPPEKGAEGDATKPSRPAGGPAPWQQTPEVSFQSLSPERYRIFQSPSRGGGCFLRKSARKR